MSAREFLNYELTSAFLDMEEREQKRRKVRHAITNRLLRFYAQLLETCTNPEKFLQNALKKPRIQLAERCAMSQLTAATAYGSPFKKFA